MDSADVEQGTPEWFEARLGCTTACGIHNVLSKPRKRGQEESAGRRNYKAQIVCEILSGKLSKDDQIETWWMKRGKDLEPDARSEYELRNGVMVQTCGFIKHPRIARYGCSPDGLVGEEGLVQIKCLNRANHLDCWTYGIPSEFKEQMICELSVCADRTWNDFVSYHPEFPAHLKLFVRRVFRKDVLPEIEKMEMEVIVFNEEVRQAVDMLPKPGQTLESLLERSIEQAKGLAT